MRELGQNINSAGFTGDPVTERSPRGLDTLEGGPVEPTRLPMPDGSMEQKGKGSDKNKKQKGSSDSGNMGANETIAGLLAGAGLEPKVPKPFPPSKKK